MLKLTKVQSIKILIVYILLALAAVCCYNIKMLLAPVRKRPFHCNDESLRKPFVDDTIPPDQLHILGIYIPLVLIAMGELISSLALRKPSQRYTYWLLKYVLKTIIIVTLFLIGLAVERLSKNVCKIKMARLRPNFRTVCDPVDVYGDTCERHDDDSFVMKNYECTSDSYPTWAVKTAFASFPSGHTSLISYAMIFLICYLHCLSLKLKHLHAPSTLVILIMQVLCFFLIIFVGVSRVLDFRHYWSDVCAGFIGGSCIALVLYYYLESRLDNVEEWLGVVIGAQHTADIENAAAANTNINNAKQNNYVMELVSE